MEPLPFMAAADSAGVDSVSCSRHQVRTIQLRLEGGRVGDTRANRSSIKLEPCWFQGEYGVRTERIKRFRCNWALQSTVEGGRLHWPSEQ